MKELELRPLLDFDGSGTEGDGDMEGDSQNPSQPMTTNGLRGQDILSVS